MSDTPRTDRLLESLETHQFHGDAGDVVDFARGLERELAIESAEKMKYRERAWHAESQLEERYGLRKEINAELGLTDETGDDALRKGLETIKALKVERNWNKISDGLPPMNTPVLILAELYHSGEPIVCAAYRCSPKGQKEYWCCHGAGGMECENDFDNSTITHWMPLPNTPKGT